MRRLAGLCALVVVLGVGLWLAFGGRETRGRAPAADAGAPRVEAQPDAQPAPPPVRAPAAPALAPATVESSPSTREALPSAFEEELARGHWVEGRVVFPSGTPLDEKAFVVARGKKFERGEHHRVEVAHDGSFRVAFSEKTRSGSLALEARYVYLAQPARWSAKDAPAPLMLEPRLGGRIEGKLVLPAGASADAQGHLALTTTIQESANSSSSSEGPPVDVRADLTFQFDALDPQAEYEVKYDGPTFVGGSGDVAVAAGETRRLDVELRAGVVLAGRVRNEAGEPLSGVFVLANLRERNRGGLTRSSGSAADGSFRLDALPAGDVELQATLQGYEQVRKTLGKLAEGERREDLGLVLARGNSIAGRVQWPDGSPAQAWVAVVDEKERDSNDEQKTAADGSFEVSGLGDGTFRVSARGKRDEEVTVKSELTGLERKKQQAVSWRAEQERVPAGTRDLVLTLTSGLALSGRVVDEAGAAVSDFTLRALRHREGADFVDLSASVSKKVHDAGGAFTLDGFTAGTWSITAGGGAGAPYASSEALRVELPSAAPVVIILPHAAALNGVVLDPRGAPVAGANVSIDREDRVESFSFGSDDRKTDAHGAFALRRLAPGSLKLGASAKGFASSEPLVLTLAPGEQQRGLVLRLRTGGSITGDVLGASGRPEVGQHVWTWRQDGDSEFGDAETDGEGRFEIDGLVAGTYSVQADTSSGIHLSANVTLAEGGTEHVRLALASGTLVRLHGRVTVGGEVMADLQVSADLMDSDQGQSSTSCDSEGAYELTVAAAGRYRVSVNRSSRDSLSWSTTVDVPQVSDFPLDIALPVGRVRGRVTSRDGAPLAGVSVRSQTDRDDTGPWSHADTTTDSDGRYELLLPAGSMTLTAGGRSWRPSAGTDWAEARVSGVSVAANQTLEGVDFVLSKGGTLAGRVRRADGRPVGQVAIFRGEGEDRDWLDGTRDDGSFSISGLEPGTILVGAAGEHCVTLRSKAVTLQAGEVTQLELEVVPAVGVHVRVHGAAGARDPEVTALDGQGHPVPAANHDSEAWIGPLVAGRYTLRAVQGDKQAERTLEIRGDEDTLEIELTPR